MLTCNESALATDLTQLTLEPVGGSAINHSSGTNSLPKTTKKKRRAQRSRNGVVIRRKRHVSPLEHHGCSSANSSGSASTVATGTQEHSVENSSGIVGDYSNGASSEGSVVHRTWNNRGSVAPAHTHNTGGSMASVSPAFLNQENTGYGIDHTPQRAWQYHPQRRSNAHVFDIGRGASTGKSGGLYL